MPRIRGQSREIDIRGGVRLRIKNLDPDTGFSGNANKCVRDALLLKKSFKHMRIVFTEKTGGGHGQIELAQQPGDVHPLAAGICAVFRYPVDFAGTKLRYRTGQIYGRVQGDGDDCFLHHALLVRAGPEPGPV